MEELDQSPDSSFQKDIMSESNDSFLLSTDNMKALKIFHDEVGPPGPGATPQSSSSA